LNADAAKELMSHAVPLGSVADVVPLRPSTRDAKRNNEVLGTISADTFEKADEFIEDQIDALAEPGPDSGVDVFASKDGLGLEEPRIFVEVKHRAKQIESKDIRAFVGGRRKGDKCLYVSTGGFSKDAYYEAERAEVALTLVTLPRLRKLVVDFYDRLDSEIRTLVPLRRLYWPVVRAGEFVEPWQPPGAIPLFLYPLYPLTRRNPFCASAISESDAIDGSLPRPSRARSCARSSQRPSETDAARFVARVQRLGQRPTDLA
jgi:restriction endonuclease